MVCSSVQQCLHALVHCSAVFQHDGTVERGHPVLLGKTVYVHTTVVQHILQALQVTILRSNMKSI